MVCYLEDYRTRVGTLAARTAWRVQGRNIKGQVRSYLENTCLCAEVLVILLVIGGVEQNPGTGVEGESLMQVNRSACDKILKSGTQCDTCGRWFHDSCGNVKAQLVDSGKLSCEICKWERLCLPEERLQNALNQTEDLKLRNNKLEEQLRVAPTANEIGRQVTVQEHREGEQCLVVGDSIIRNVGTGQNTMMVGCFPGIRTEQLHRVLENVDLWTPDIVVIHVGRNDLKRSVNLDCVMGEVYWLVNAAKVKFPQYKIVLSGVLRRTDLAWRTIGALNDRYHWIAKTLGVFVGPNSWLEDWDFARDGLRINRRRTRRLSQLYSRVGGLGGRGKKMDGHLMLNVFYNGTSERTRKTPTQRKFDADLENDGESGGDDESDNEGVRSRVK